MLQARAVGIDRPSAATANRRKVAHISAPLDPQVRWVRAVSYMGAHPYDALRSQRVNEMSLPDLTPHGTSLVPQLRRRANAMLPLPDARAARRLFLLQTAGLLGLAIAVWLAFGLVDTRSQEREARLAQTIGDTAMRRALEHHLSGFVSDLFIAARSPLLHGAVGEDMGELARHYAVQLEERPTIDQIRYLDLSGKEVVRVSREGDRARISPPGELQDKSGRYYFRRAYTLEVGEVYISQLDLNLQQGVIETPWKPTIRMATPIAANYGATVGVLVCNFSADRLLESFSTTSTPNGIHRELLNGDGYWLAGRAPHELWGFLFDHTVSAQYYEPKIWQWILSRPQRPTKLDDTLYHASAINLQRFLDSQSSAKHTVHTDERWYILTRTPLPSLFAFSQTLGVSGVLVLLGAVTISWHWSRDVVGRRLAERQNAQSERELVRAERMASLGGLVAGVAHELNTPIGNAVMIASSIHEHGCAIEKEIGSGQLRKSSIVSFLEQTRSGSALALRNLERAADLIGKFKGVAVDQTSEHRRTFGLDQYLLELESTLQTTFKNSGTRLEVSANSAAIMDSYPGALAQVVINLVNNALLHGFRIKQGGVVSIKAELQDADQARLVVEDSGDGISQDLAERIFDPFFTTRLGEGGTGLGLSITQNIVHNLLGGHIELLSHEGKFSRFTVTVPLRAPHHSVPPKDPHHVQAAIS